MGADACVRPSAPEDEGRRDPDLHRRAYVRCRTELPATTPRPELARAPFEVENPAEPAARSAEAGWATCAAAWRSWHTCVAGDAAAGPKSKACIEHQLAVGLGLEIVEQAMSERVHRKYGNKKTQFAGDFTAKARPEPAATLSCEALERMGLISNLRRQKCLSSWCQRQAVGAARPSTSSPGSGLLLPGAGAPRCGKTPRAWKHP